MTIMAITSTTSKKYNSSR